MIVVITSKIKWPAIESGVKASGNEVADTCFAGTKKASDCLSGYMRIHPKILILDLQSIEDQEKDDVRQAMQSFRILSDMTRIILINPDGALPGDLFISDLVNMGIWDVIANVDLAALADRIAECINVPTPYRVAARWQQSTIEAEKKAAQPVREVVKTITEIKTVVKHVESKLIIVSNATRRAGSSLIALNLSRYLSKGNLSARLVELPIDRPMLYRMAFMDRKILDNYEGDETDSDIIIQKFVSMPHEIVTTAGIVNQNLDANRDGNLIYYVLAPDKNLIENWTAENTEDLLKVSQSTVTVIDVGSYLFAPAVSSILAQADVIISLIEPVVTEWMMCKELECVKTLQEKGYPVKFVANKVTPKSRVKEMVEHLKIDVESIPFISPEQVQDAIYNGWYLVDKSREFENALRTVSKGIIPSELIKPKIFRK